MPALNPDPKSPIPAPRRVLIVRPSALGDVARTVPAVVSIKKKWPGCRVEWVVSRAFVEAVAHHPGVDEVVAFDRDRPTAFLGLMRELRRRKYDVVYDFQGLARSGLLAWATGAKRRVGFADAREGGWLGCNVKHSVGAGVGGVGLHAVDRMLGLLEADGVERVEDMRLYVGQADEAWAKAWRAEQDLETKKYWVLAPTAQWGCKCWPAERYAMLAEQVLREERTGKVVVVCGPSEKEAVHGAFREALLEASRGFGGGTSGGVWSKLVWPTTTVGQLMAVIGGAEQVVCNDSAALHLAVGLGVSTVSLFGPTDPALVGPFGYGQGGAGAASVLAGGLPGVPGGARHTVVRAKGAVAGARDYRRHKDDDTLMRGITVGEVVKAVTAGGTGAQNL